MIGEPEVEIEACHGTQSVARAFALMRLLARNEAEGATLTQLSRSIGLPHPTVRRILKGLIAERAVAHNPATQRYMLGRMLFELGLAVPVSKTLQRVCRPHLETLAQTTQETTYLIIRSGADAVCLDRIEGTAPIRAVTQTIGGRRPLGFGAAALAVLAALPDDQIDVIIRAHDESIRRNPILSADTLRQAVVETRNNGYAVSRDVSVAGTSGVGVVLPTKVPFAAVSIGTITASLTDSRIASLIEPLRCTGASMAMALDRMGEA